MRELERETTRNRRAPALAIVGPGRVGRSVARALRGSGQSHALYGRGEPIPAGTEAVLLCVPDDAIEDAAEAVATAGARFVGHTSGATGLAALGSVTAAGSGAFSLHPLMTVPDGETDLTGAPAAIAGSGEDALALARDVALRLGMRPFEVAEESRAAYHAAASMASNFLIALEESAVELLGKAGIPDGRELLAPLVLRSAANWSDRGGAALTGPISRGDEATVARHVAALEAVDPELLDLYRALAERTASIAAGRREAEDAEAGVAR